MSHTVFVNGVTLTDATWFQDVDSVTYTNFGNGSAYTGSLTLSASKIITLTGSTSGTTIIQPLAVAGGTLSTPGVTANLSGCINTQTSATGIGNGADTTDDTLFTYTLPANALSANGMSVRISGWGLFAATANQKNLRSYFAGTGYIPEGTGNGFNNKAWRVDMVVTRIDATHVSISVAHFVDANNVFLGSALNASVADLSANSSIIKITGQSPISGSANDVVAYGMKTWIE